MSVIEAPHVWTKKNLTRLDKFKSLLYAGRKRGLPKGSHLSDLIALGKVIILCWECNHVFYPHHKSENYRLDEMKVNATCDLCHRAHHQAHMYMPEENWSVAHATHPDDGKIVDTSMYQAIPVRYLHPEDKAFLKEVVKKV